MAVFRELQGVNVKFLFSNPEKANPCTKPCRLTYYVENRFRDLGCRSLEEPELLQCPLSVAVAVEWGLNDLNR